MKNIFFILSFFLFFASCESTITEFDHFNIDHTFEESFSFSIDSSDYSNNDFDESIEFNITDDESFKAYVDQITDYKVTSAGFKITSYEGNINARGTGRVEIISNNIILGSNQFMNLSFADFKFTGDVYELYFTDATILAIKEALLVGQKIIVNVSGSVSSRPIDEIEMVVFLSVEARVDIQ